MVLLWVWHYLFLLCLVADDEFVSCEDEWWQSVWDPSTTSIAIVLASSTQNLHTDTYVHTCMYLCMTTTCMYYHIYMHVHVHVSTCSLCIVGHCVEV